MSYHPLNLTLRFLLELTALVGLGLWGWRMSDSPLRFVTVIALPLVFAVLWGTFAVPDDKSRSGKAPVPTNGIIRLMLELALFGLGVFGFIIAGLRIPGVTFGGLVILHYALSAERIRWLISQRPNQ